MQSGAKLNDKMRQFTKAELSEKVTVTCYRQTETMTREQAIDEYYEGMMMCDGSEAERYQTIYCQLMEGLTEVSDEV